MVLATFAKGLVCKTEKTAQNAFKCVGFFFAWEFQRGGFVDNVDNVDALFKLVADEVSALPYSLSR